MIGLARFFLQPGQLQRGQVVISGDDAHHIIKVLRLRVGDEIECVDPDGEVHLVQLQELGSRILGTVTESFHSHQESPLTLTLFQALAKGDKMDLVVQKAVELGAARVVPFSSRYTIVKLDEKQAKTRRARWQRIALEAAKQSGRNRIPEVAELHSFAQLESSIKRRQENGERIILAYEDEKQLGIKDLEGVPDAVSLIVGPEGGFAPEEVESLKLAGAAVCTLGPRILRTETAGLALLSIVGYKWGDLG